MGLRVWGFGFGRRSGQELADLAEAKVDALLDCLRGVAGEEERAGGAEPEEKRDVRLDVQRSCCVSHSLSLLLLSHSFCVRGSDGPTLLWKLCAAAHSARPRLPFSGMCCARTRVTSIQVTMLDHCLALPS